MSGEFYNDEVRLGEKSRASPSSPLFDDDFQPKRTGKKINYFVLFKVLHHSIFPRIKSCFLNIRYPNCAPKDIS